MSTSPSDRPADLAGPQPALVAAPTPAPHRFRLMPVRIADVRLLRESRPPLGPRLPQRHGHDNDPRYPSPHILRRVFGIGVDVLIHVGVAVGIGVAVGRVPSVAAYAGVIGVGVFFVLSLVHRIVVQWAIGTTLGKALFGVCLIRDDTGGRPTPWSLTKAWFVDGLKAIFNVVSLP